MVFRSADPDFFIAHFDVSRILKWVDLDTRAKEHPLNDDRMQAIREGASRQEFLPSSAEKLRRSSKVSIAEIAGRAGGGGNEFCSGCDMRFGLAGKTKFNQMEVPLGILPGGNGTVNLPKLIGRNRALEMILGGVDIDAETAERWGLPEPRPSVEGGPVGPRRRARPSHRELSDGRGVGGEAVRVEFARHVPGRCAQPGTSALRGDAQGPRVQEAHDRFPHGAGRTDTRGRAQGRRPGPVSPLLEPMRRLFGPGWYGIDNRFHVVVEIDWHLGQHDGYVNDQFTEGGRTWPTRRPSRT